MRWLGRSIGFGTSALRGQSHASGSFNPGKQPRYPLCKWLGGLQGPHGQVRKALPPPEFEPQTVHSVRSHYTDCAIPAPSHKSSAKVKNEWSCDSIPQCTTLTPWS